MVGVLCVGIATQDFVFGMDEMPVRAEKAPRSRLRRRGWRDRGDCGCRRCRLGGRALLATAWRRHGRRRIIARALEADGVDCSPTYPPQGHPFVAFSRARKIVPASAWSSIMAIQLCRTTLLHSAFPMAGWRACRDGGYAMGNWCRRRVSCGPGLGRLWRAGCRQSVQNRDLLTELTDIAYAAQAVREMTGPR